MIGGEPPSKIRGGAKIGGIGAAKPAEIGAGDRVRAAKRLPAESCSRRRRTEAVAERRRRAGRRAATSIRRMFILIVGCGRVGSSVARAMLREGHEVSCLDEDPESHARLEVGLEKSWEDLGGQFTVGAGLETEALVAAGIEQADAFIASTDGDNTNIIIAQIAQKRYEVPTVIARVLDPLRAEWYAAPGPAHDLPDPRRDRHARGGRPQGRRNGSAPDDAAAAA